MRGIYVPKKNVAFVVSHRGGSRLLLSALKYFFDFSNIKYEYIGYDKMHDFTDKNKKIKFYILTRNPIERFISGFSWLQKSEDIEYVRYVEKYKIENISDFTKQYEKIMIEDPNVHFLPQTYAFLSLGDDYKLDDFKKLNYRKTFDKMYYHYHIIHIEDIGFLLNKDFEETKKNIFIDIENTNFTAIPNFKSRSIEIFESFSKCDDKLKNIFLFSYFMCKKYLDKNHHSPDYIKLQPHDYQYLINFFYEETIFYGYNNFDLTERIVKPENINLKNII